ncbi:MAG: iron chaperone [Coriobacteriia bacterium]
MAEDTAGTKTARRPTKKKVDGLTEVLENIASMPEHDQAMARRFHSIIERTAPSLKPRLWYGMPAYTKDGKVLCFFQSAAKFKARYATVGFDEVAALDDGAMWPTSYALTELGDEEEARIEELVRKAMG